MAKQECGTCRFFEKSGIGATGYCRNERCRAIVGIALVRKHELACRVGWDQNYYEPLPTAAIPGEERPRVDSSLQRGYQGTRPDDLVVGVEQSRPVTKDIVNQPISRKPLSHVSEAHRRALERKQQAQQAGAPAPIRRLETVLPGPVAPQDVTANTSAEWEQAASEGVSLPRRRDTLPIPPSPALDIFAPPVAGNATAQTVALPVVEPGGEIPPPRERRDELVPPSHPAPERRGVAPPGMPMGKKTVGLLSDAPGRVLPTNEVALPAAGARSDDLNAQWYASQRAQHRGKRCANCRDFRRSAEGSDHGYCKNPWAFPAPQSVQSSDLACLSALGTWWAASDAWWSGRPTAHMSDADEPRTEQVLNEWQGREDRSRSRRDPEPE